MVILNRVWWCRVPKVSLRDLGRVYFPDAVLRSASIRFIKISLMRGEVAGVPQVSRLRPGKGARSTKTSNIPGRMET